MIWSYENNNIPADLSEYIGFVYLITNLQTNRKYIGKKLLKFKKVKTIKGKKKKILVESDWRTYWGSNDELKNDVKELGEINFKREVLIFCKSKGELSYFELKEQIVQGALESDEYYNSWIMARVRKDHLKKVDFSR
jgi:hypothetical protein